MPLLRGVGVGLSSPPSEVEGEESTQGGGGGKADRTGLETAAPEGGAEGGGKKPRAGLFRAKQRSDLANGEKLLLFEGTCGHVFVVMTSFW